MSWQLLAKAAGHLAKKKIADKVTQGSGPRWWRVALIVAIATSPLAVVTAVVLLGAVAFGAGAPVAAASGAVGIPPVLFSAYLTAEANARMIAPDCVVDWPIVAGIWKVESNHAITGGRTITPDGNVTPPIYGPTLDGSTPGTAVIPDSDNGMLDGDTTWDRAVGPAQFLPGSWRAYGQDANRDGVADPQNVHDAALGTVAHLCLTAPGDYTNPIDLAAALRRYNNSETYVTTVAGWIDYYRSFTLTNGSVTADGLYAFPLPHDTVTLDQIRASHHDYPASDLAVTEGTPVYAVHPGTVSNVYEPCPTCTCGWGVTITGLDNHRYTYCHGTQLAVEAGTEVAAGQLVMLAGATGNAQGPHLHFQIRNPTGTLVCPQTLLEAWWTGIGLSPVTAPTDGCTH